MRYFTSFMSVSLVLLCATSFFPLRAGAGDIPSPDRLLRTLEAQSGFTEPVYACVEVIHKGAWYTHPDNRSALSTVHRRTWSDLYYDGKTLGVETRNFADRTEGGGSRSQRCRTIFGDNCTLEYVERSDGAGEAVRQCYALSTYRAGHATWGLELLGMAHGTHTTLASVVSTNPDRAVKPKMESIGGAPCYVVESSGRDNAWTLWLDPNAGGLPRRVQGTWTIQGGKEASDLMHQFAVSTPPESAGSFDGPFRCTLAMDDIVIGGVPARPFLQRARIKMTVSAASGLTYSTTDQAILNGIQYGQNSEAAPFLAMADLPPVATETEVAPNKAPAPYEFSYSVSPAASAIASVATPVPPGPSLATRLGWLLQELSVSRLRERNPATLLAGSAVLALLINAAVYMVGRRRRAAGHARPHDTWGHKQQGRSNVPAGH